MRTDSEEIHCCSLLQTEGVELVSEDHEQESDVSRHNNSTSRTVGADITSNRVLPKEAVLAKRWPMTPDSIADLLADLVFVMLILLLFVWVGLWTFVQ